MSFEVTSHDVVPVGRSKNGMTAALRSLQVNQSIHVPCDGSDPSKQRVRIGAICNYVGNVRLLRIVNRYLRPRVFFASLPLAH